MENKERQLARQKDVAAWALSTLNVSTPYIMDFKKNNGIYLFDCACDGEARRIDINSELMDKVLEIEQKRNLKVYAVTHDDMPYIGETYSFFCVSPYMADGIGTVQLVPNKRFARVYAYVYNVNRPGCSKSGFVVIRINGGNLVRVR